MAVLTEIVVVDYRVALAAFIVIFVILFLLYRERRQQQHQQPSIKIAGDVHYKPTVKYQFLHKEEQNKPKKDYDDVSDEGAKSEPPRKTFEKSGCDDKEEARGSRKSLRHRRNRTRSHDDSQNPSVGDQNSPGQEATGEIERRVFSEPVATASSTEQEAKKAFLDNWTADGQKEDEETAPKSLEGLEMGVVNAFSTPSGEGKNPPQSHQSTTINEAKIVDDGVPVPTYNTDSPTRPFEFTVDKRGCHVASQYSRLDIPPGATLEPQTITMEPSYKMKPRSPSEVLVTPYVSFKTQNGCEPKFLKDVTLELYTGYAAVDGKKGIPVEILWKKDSASAFMSVGKATLRQEKFISFKCRHFCGYCLAAEQSHFHSMRRYYYYAGYVRTPQRAPTRIFHWMLFEDCPLSFEQNMKYLNTNNDGVKVIDPEMFWIDYDYNIQLVIKSGQVCPGRRDRRNVPLSQQWGSRVSLTNQFHMENKSGRSNAHLEIEYQMFAVHNRNGPHLQIREKEFYYEWVDPVAQSTTINVYDHGTGVRCTSYAGTEQPRVDHQESVDSNTSRNSSGYGSPPASVAHRPFEDSFRSVDQSASPPTGRQDSGFNDQDELAVTTTPKTPSPIDSPRWHSTPQHSPVPPEVDARGSDLPRESPETPSESLSLAEDGLITPGSLQNDGSGLGEFSSLPESLLGPTNVGSMTSDLSGNVSSIHEDRDCTVEPPSSDSSPASLETESVPNVRDVPSSDSRNE